MHLISHPSVLFQSTLGCSPGWNRQALFAWTLWACISVGNTDKLMWSRKPCWAPSSGLAPTETAPLAAQETSSGHGFPNRCCHFVFGADPTCCTGRTTGFRFPAREKDLSSLFSYPERLRVSPRGVKLCSHLHPPPHVFMMYCAVHWCECV
jgi:hypothetical protein